MNIHDQAAALSEATGIEWVVDEFNPAPMNCVACGQTIRIPRLISAWPDEESRETETKLYAYHKHCAVGAVMEAVQNKLGVKNG